MLGFFGCKQQNSFLLTQAEMNFFGGTWGWDIGLKGKTKEEMEEKSEEPKLEGLKPGIPVISGRATIQQFC